MAETKLKKTEFSPFLDVSGGSGTATWKRIDRSTIFALNPNPQTEERDYISYEAPVTEIVSYKPELPQEIAIYEGNPIYDFIFGLFYNLPVGDSVMVKSLMCFGGQDKKAWQVDKTTITLGELNTVDGKISFTLGFGGDITRGTYAITDGAPTFTAATEGT